MAVTIIYTHPWDGSFNHAILERTMSVLQEAGEEVQVIDLYKDGFEPAMSEKDLSLYNEGKSTDVLVEKYNKILDNTSRVILIFPIWWYDMPAMLRGFFDKVMLKGSAYYGDDTGLHAIRAIKETILLTTSSTTTDNLINKFGDPINGPIISATFAAIGFYNAKWCNLGMADKISDEERKTYLDSLKEYLA